MNMNASRQTRKSGYLEKKGKEATFRSKARWIEKGEKPTNYFLNLEKRNFEKKVIARLRLENGSCQQQSK